MAIITVEHQETGNPIQDAYRKAKAGDEIVVKPGIYKITKRAIWNKSNIKIRSSEVFGAVIDASGEGQELCFGGVDLENVWIEGFWLIGSKTSAAISFSRCNGITIKNNLVFDAYSNGLSIQQCDHILIEDNILVDNITVGARSAISLLLTDESPFPSRGNGPRVIVRGNVGWGNIATAGPPTDAGIILDGRTPKGAAEDIGLSKYQHETLLEKNIFCGNGGGGIVANWWSAKAVIRRNVSFSNQKDTRKVGTWNCEYHNMWSKNTIWEKNLAVSTKKDIEAFRVDLGKNKHFPDKSDAALGHTYVDNLLYNTAAGAVTGSDPAGLLLPAASTGTAPTLPAIPKRPTTAAEALASRKALRDAFAFVLEDAEPPVSFSVISAPAITSAEHRSGKQLTYTVGSYSVDNTPVITRAQVLDTGNVFRALPEDVSINIGKYPTIEDIAAAGISAKLDADGNPSFRIVERYTRPDGSEGVNASKAVVLLPEEVDTVELLKAQLADALSHIEELNQDIVSLNLNLEYATSERDVLATKLETAETEKTAISSALVDMTAERDALASELKELKETRSYAEVAIQALKLALAE